MSIQLKTSNPQFKSDPAYPEAVFTPAAVPASEQKWVAKASELAVDFKARAAYYDQAAALPQTNFISLSKAGLDTALLPKKYGGAAISYRTFGEIVRIIARACPSTACVWLMHVGAATGLVQLSNDEQAEFFAQELKKGKAFANALSEPSSGNQFLVPGQEAARADGGWVLDGAKRFVSGSERADYFLVNVLVDGVPAFFGVERDDTITFTDIWDALGLRATRSQLVGFNNTLLKEKFRCREPLPTEANPISVGLPFLSIGIAEAALQALIEQAQGRTVASGSTVAKLPWVQYETAQVYTELKAARLLAQHVLDLADAEDPAIFATSIEAKLLANQVVKKTADLALHVAGGSGFVKPSPIERHVRNAQAPWLMAYSVEVCKDFVAKFVLNGDKGGSSDAASS